MLTFINATGFTSSGFFFVCAPVTSQNHTMTCLKIKVFTHVQSSAASTSSFYNLAACMFDLWDPSWLEDGLLHVRITAFLLNARKI